VVANRPKYLIQLFQESKDSKDSYIHGVEAMDYTASWIKKGFVAGPLFSSTPANFRSSSIVAIPQPYKERICINDSLPKKQLKQ
jgi:hypothetical protein